MDGISVLESWRRIRTGDAGAAAHPRADRWSDKVQGFDAGARRLVAKTVPSSRRCWRAFGRCCAVQWVHAKSEFLCGPVRLDSRTGRVTWAAPRSSSPRTQYRLLSYLMHHSGRVVSRTELVEHLYDQDFDRDSNTIEVLSAVSARSSASRSFRPFAASVIC